MSTVWSCSSASSPCPRPSPFSSRSSHSGSYSLWCSSWLRFIQCIYHLLSRSPLLLFVGGAQLLGLSLLGHVCLLWPSWWQVLHVVTLPYQVNFPGYFGSSCGSLLLFLLGLPGPTFTWGVSSGISLGGQCFSLYIEKLNPYKLSNTSPSWSKDVGNPLHLPLTMWSKLLHGSKEHLWDLTFYKCNNQGSCPHAHYPTYEWLQMFCFLKVMVGSSLIPLYLFLA